VPTRYDISLASLGELLADEPAYRTKQVWTGLHGKLRTPLEMTDLPVDLRSRLEAILPTALREKERSVADDGETIKWLFELEGGARIETVLMAYPDRVTACVSSQAGCAMDCQFCATGQAGFTRQLTTGEIIEQVVTAAREALPRRLSRIVFMGMGEPLANYDRVWAAVRRLHEDLGFSARHLTISTVGIIPGIRRLTDEDLPVNLAVSLHAANDELRNRLVPINRRYPLAALGEACQEYVEKSGRRLSFEWALIDGVNDRPSDAAELAAFARPLRAHVNLIPLNPTPGYLVQGTPRAGVRDFRSLLTGLGVNATVRITRGQDIAAACGQLASVPRDHPTGPRGSGVPVRLVTTEGQNRSRDITEDGRI